LPLVTPADAMRDAEERPGLKLRTADTFHAAMATARTATAPASPASHRNPALTEGAANALRSRMRIDGDRCMRTSVNGSSGELAAALGADASAEARARDATLPPEDALTVMKAYHRRRTRTRRPATTKEPLSLPL
jgi:hypothetical protein